MSEASSSQLPAPVVEPPAEDPAREIHRAKKSAGTGRRACLLSAVFLSMAIVGGGLVFFYLLVPLFQPQVDPNLTGPTIDHTSAGDAIEEKNRRGSITDLLFQQKFRDPEHPLDPLLAVAHVGLNRIRTEVHDYTAQMVKQERIGRHLRDEEFVFCKVRREQNNEQGHVPKSVYLKFLKPRSLAGQEAIWVANRNGGKLIGHASGLLNVIRAHLEPTGAIAMRGNRYPITELGFEVLLLRMIETGQRDREYGECEVVIDRELKINGNDCTLIQVIHPVRRDHFDYHIAKIYIDDVQNIPIGYEGYLWPDEPDGEPKLIEKYFYQDVKLNVGLSDLDFDPDNPEYNYP